jgi:O-antigen/teichoic acid export membrane protein
LSSLKRFFKDTFIYGLASVLPRLINFGLVAVYSSVFDTSEFSTQTVWYIYAAFLNVVLTMGMETAFFRFYTTQSDKSKVISSSFILLVISASCFLLLSYLFANELTVFFEFEKSAFLKLLVWTTFLDTLVVIPFAYLRVTGRPLKFLFLKTANVLFLVVVVVLLLITIPKLIKTGSNWPSWLGFSDSYKPDVIHIFIANVAASAFTFLCLAPYFFKINWFWDRSLIKRLLQYGLPIMIGGLAYVVNENADKLMLAQINPDDNGIYSACYKLGVFMTLYITAFRLGAEPFFFNHAGTSDAKVKYAKIMTWFVILGGCFMLGVVVFLDFFAQIFLKNQVYWQGLMIVPIILLANLFSGIYNNLSIWYKLTDQTRFGMGISIFGAFITVISLWVLLPKFGIIGGAYATLFAYVIMALISWYLGQKYYPVPYENIKIIAAITLASGFSAISFIYFRNNMVVGILLMITYLGFILVMVKKDVQALLSKK